MGQKTQVGIIEIPKCTECEFDFQLCTGSCKKLQKDYQMESSALNIAMRDIEKYGALMQSEKFQGVQYTVKDDHIIILAGADGKLAVEFKRLDSLIKELEEIKEVYAK